MEMAGCYTVSNERIVDPAPPLSAVQREALKRALSEWHEAWDHALRALIANGECMVRTHDSGAPELIPDMGRNIPRVGTGRVVNCWMTTVKV